MLRFDIDHCVYGRMYCLQRGIIHRREWQSRKAHENAEEMVMAIFQMGKYYVQTMGREAASVVAETIYVSRDGAGASYNVDRDRVKGVL